jgi:hypothetical protein
VQQQRTYVRSICAWAKLLTVNIIFIVVFGRKLFAIGDKDLGAQKQCKGRCYCEHGGPGGECDSEYFSDAALAQHTQQMVRLKLILPCVES